MERYANIKTNVGEDFLMTWKDMSPQMNNTDYIIT